MREVDTALLPQLVCPVTRQPLRYDEGAGELVSDAAGLAFPVRDGVPVMLADAARPVSARAPEAWEGSAG